MFEPYNHLFSLVGSLMTLGYVLKQAKDAWDDGKFRSWRKWFRHHWDDLAWILFIAQCLAFGQEVLWGLWVAYKDDPNAWDFYIDNSEGIALVIGLFGTAIFQRLQRLGVRKIGKMD